MPLMSTRFPAVAYFVLISCLFVAGCGGASSPGVGSAQAVSPKINIKWATRGGRQVNASAAALSTRVILRNAGTENEDFVWVINRDDLPTGYSKDYVSAVRARAGKWSLKVEMFPDRHAYGPTIAEGAYACELGADGSLLNNQGGNLVVDIASSIKSITITPNQEVTEGQLRTLDFGAFGEFGQMVPISAGALLFSQVSGANKVAVQPDGVIRGLLAGKSVLTATMDGLSTGQVPVLCKPNPSNYAKRFDISPFDAVATGDGNTLFVSDRTSNVIKRIDVATGAASAFKTMTYTPGALAMSANGQYLYVGSYLDQYVSRVNVATKAIDYVINLGPGLFFDHYACRDIAVNPSDPDLIAVILSGGNVTNSTFGVRLYNRTAKLPNEYGNRASALTYDSTGASLYGCDGESSDFALFKATVSSQGLSDFVEKQNVFTNFTQLMFLDGELYATSGQYLNATTLELAHSLRPSSGFPYIFPDKVANRYLTVSYPFVDLQVLSTQKLVSRLELDYHPSGINAIVLGGGRFAVWSFDRLYVISKMPEYL